MRYEVFTNSLYMSKKILLLCFVAGLLMTCKKEVVCINGEVFIVHTTYTTAKIGWQPRKEAIGIFYRDSSNKTWTEIPVQNDTFILENLNTNTTYELRLKYKCPDSKYSTYTKPTFFKTKPTPNSINLGKEYFNKDKQNFISLTFDGNYFYVLSHKDNDLDNTIYKYSFEKTGALDSFHCPFNSKSISFDGNNLVIGWDTAGKYSTKLAKISRVNGMIISETKCHPQLKKESQTFEAACYENGSPFILATNHSKLESWLYRINESTNEIEALQEFDFHISSVVIPKSFTLIGTDLFLITLNKLMKFDLLKYPTLVGQVSEVPM